MNSDALKNKVKTMARETNVDHQAIMQSYFLERLLDRISVSSYRQNFILKGGLLIASLIGISNRSTMDIDTTIKGYLVNEEEITKLLTEILSIDRNDDVQFVMQSIKSIREEDDYDGFRVVVRVKFGKIEQHVKIDISTGDVITPSEIDYTYKSAFDDSEFNVLAYNLETVLAEKIETVIRRGAATTRMRDYYDIHVLSLMRKDEINQRVLQEALINTSKKRESDNLFGLVDDILELLNDSPAIKSLWKNYQDKYYYASNIELSEVMESIKWIIDYAIDS